MATATSDSTFQKDVLDAEGLVLVDFWADWCGPCKMLAPIIEELSKEVGDKVKVLKLDTSENMETPSKYNVMGIPTVILFKNGEIAEQWVGVQPKNVYVEGIEKHK